MDRPAVILVPPTPIRANLTDYSLTPSLIKPSLDEEQRTSSDTTIVTIYSMYSERPSSWSAEDGKAGHGRHDSFYQAPSRSPSRASEYYSLENAPQSRRSSKRYSNFADLSKESSAESHENGISLVSHGHSHRSAGWDKDANMTDDGTSSSYNHSSLAPQTNSSNATTPKSDVSANHLRPTRPPRSRPPSAHSKSAIDDSVLSAPLPPTPTVTPPATPPKLKISSLMPPPSTSSHTSILSTPYPSDGEDPDSFHVRNTYALLDQSGVKGDGYEEGIERTRARLTAGSNAELKASEVIADGSEKQRELSQNEVELLESLDRFVGILYCSHKAIFTHSIDMVFLPFRHTIAMSYCQRRVSRSI